MPFWPSRKRSDDKAEGPIQLEVASDFRGGGYPLVEGRVVIVWGKGTLPDAKAS